MNTTSDSTASPAAGSPQGILHAEIVARTGIDRNMVERLVHRFYDKARVDPLLGPVFDSKVEHWDVHLERMCSFWWSVATMAGTYHGNPMMKHAPLTIDAAHFDRWLALFEATAAEVCPPQAAGHFVERARRIAQSLELGVALQAGAPPRPGERFHRDAVG